jgi:hypothetical protein
MRQETVEKIADAILYEGYILYPYRPSSVKNRQRWNFGSICPREYSDAQHGTEAWRTQAECLVSAPASSGAKTSIGIKIRFLHIVARQVCELAHPVDDLSKCAEQDFREVDSLRLGDGLYQTWQEAIDRGVEIPEMDWASLTRCPQEFRFDFSAARELEPLREPAGAGRIVAALVRTRHALSGAVRVSVQPLAPPLFRLRVELENLTPLPRAREKTRDQAMLDSFVSCHSIFRLEAGDFVSLLDPPEAFQEAAAKCENIGNYPVLVGEEGERHTVLASPVILYDYPKIAPESAGNLFDGTEIDEILTLRILSMTDEEKAEMRQADERGRKMLERIEADPQHLANLHGVMKPVPSESLAPPPAESPAPDSPETSVQDWNPWEERAPIQSIRILGIDLKLGDRVRLHPQKNADIMDVALTGRVAIIEAIEQDLEDHIQLAVVLDDDPGREFGMMRQPGHRFFYSPEEVIPCAVENEFGRANRWSGGK